MQPRRILQEGQGIDAFAHPVRHIVQEFLDGNSIRQMDATCQKWAKRCEIGGTKHMRLAVRKIPPGCFGISGEFAVSVNSSDGLLTATVFSLEDYGIASVDLLQTKDSGTADDIYVAQGKTTKESVLWTYRDDDLSFVALSYCFATREISIQKCLLPWSSHHDDPHVSPQRHSLFGLEVDSEGGKHGFRIYEFDASGKNILQMSPLILDHARSELKSFLLCDRFFAIISEKRIIIVRQEGLAFFSSFHVAESGDWRTDGDHLYHWNADNDLAQYDVWAGRDASGKFHDISESLAR